jgi:uncharacterized protein (DUF2345 family)
VPQIRTLRTPVGNQILMTDLPPAIAVVTPSGSSLTMGPDGVNLLSAQSLKIAVGDNLLVITPAGITVTSAKGISVAAGTDLTLVAGGKLTLIAGGECAVAAPMIRLN